MVINRYKAITGLSILLRTKSLLRKWKRFKFEWLAWKKSYDGNYMPRHKSNEAELNLFLSTDEASSTGWHLVTGLFTAMDKPGYNCTHLRNDNSGKFRESSFPHIYLLKYLHPHRLFTMRNLWMYFRGISVAYNKLPSREWLHGFWLC